MLIMRFGIKKPLTIILSLTILCVLLFSMFHFKIVQHIKGQLSNCPFAIAHSSICGIYPVEHLQEWQNMLTSLPVKDITPILATLLLVGTLTWISYFSLIEIIYLYTSHFSRYNFHIYDPLKEAFSDGILNPKLF